MRIKPIQATTAKSDYLLDIEKPKSFWGEQFLQGDFMIVYAPAKTGKTRITFGLAHSLSLGQEFLGNECTKSKVLYIDGELSSYQRQAIQREIVNGLEKPDINDNLKIISKYENQGVLPNLSDRSGQIEYLKLIKKHKADIVIFDNLSCLSEYKDTRDSDLAEWQRILKFILHLRSLKISVILVDHSSKSGTLYGTVKKLGSADTVMRLEKSILRREEDKFDMEVDFPYIRATKAPEAKFVRVNFFPVQGDEGGMASKFEYSPLNQVREDVVGNFKNMGLTNKQIAEMLSMPLDQVATYASKAKSFDESLSVEDINFEEVL